MALVSPGVEVSIIDESQYLPASTNTIPYILVATAQNKLSGTGTGAALATLAANVNKTYLITSQRELVATYGNPFFYSSTAGTSLNGYELNEYGLLTAYSVLGASNRCYVQRVDVDLSELTAASSRPTGSADNNSYWLDTTETTWGVFEWSASTNEFTNKIPLIVDQSTQVTSNVPKASVGAIGDYAVVTLTTANALYYKNSDNAWVLVGSNDWQDSHWALQSTSTNPTLVTGNSIVINGTTVTLAGTTVSTLASAINSASIVGISAAAVAGKLEIYANSDVDPGDSTNDGAFSIVNGSGTILSLLGITAGTKYAPDLQQTAHTSIPRWKTSDTTPRPTGAVWVKTSAVNNGAVIAVKKYNSTTGLWTTLTVPLYVNDAAANKALDSSGGGRNVLAGTVYGWIDWSENDTATLKLHVRSATGDTIGTSNVTAPVIITGSTFTISASVKASADMSSPVTATVSGTTAAAWVTAFTAANVANTSATVLSNGAVQVRHTQGGIIEITDVVNTATATIFGYPGSSLTNVRLDSSATVAYISNWNALEYTASNDEPTQDPVANTYWYYSELDAVDIMIHNGTTWKGYRGIANDTRGFNLTNTDPSGPQVSPTAPTLQSDDTALVTGDLWVDTSDLEHYPLLKRWESINGVDQWVTIDLTDSTTENGILFADARWATADVDPVTADLSTIVDLLTSDRLDLDAPDPDLYPAGTLLWNTRRSGYNVKQFRVDYFNATDFPDDALPTYRDAWVNASGNKNSGAPYMGRKAQRAIIVNALKAGIDANTEIREEQRDFNLLACPGYPELITNLVTLNNDRNNTGFIVGDSPLRLGDNSNNILDWATDANGVGVDSEDGLVTADPYCAVFHPAGRTNDLSGNSVVVPASHMMLRTIIRNDESGYPWLAPAGNRRGVIDNINALGYVNAQTGDFVQVANRQSVRDTLYENNMNPLTFIPGTGLVNFGNKTTAAAPSSLDRINVARLVAYLRNRLEAIGKTFMFEPNDTITRNEVKNAIEQLLNDVVAKRGLYDYLVVCDDTNNTPARIDRNELYIDIAVEPIKSVEYIYIPIRLKNTGEIASGV